MEFKRGFLQSKKIFFESNFDADFLRIFASHREESTIHSQNIFESPVNSE